MYVLNFYGYNKDSAMRISRTLNSMMMGARAEVLSRRKNLDL